MLFYRLVFSAVILLTPFMVSGQKQRVKISRESVTMGEVFNEIEKQYGYTVAYSNSKLDPSAKVSFFWRSGRLERVMGRVLKTTGLTFLIKGKQIILVTPERLARIKADKSSIRETDTEPEDTLIVKVPHLTNEIDYIVVTQPNIPDMLYDNRFPEILENQNEPENNYKFNDKEKRKIESNGFALKTNLLHIATLSPNIGMEVRLSEKWTLEGSLGFNPWRFRKSDLKHTMVRLEGRYWPQGTFNGHFFGLDAVYANYDIREMSFMMLQKKHTAKGDAYGAGLAYGYLFKWAGKWGMELNAGLGYARLVYEKRHHDNNINKHHKNYFGLTRLGATLIYFIK